MSNTNFQTFHQMGRAINEVVRQATGRDAVQNIDMDHVTVAQNQYYEEVTVSGSKVSFTDRVGNTPLEKCVVQIEPVQDLHGYDRPWAGGAGKNLLDENVIVTVNENVTLQKNGEVFTLTANNVTWGSTYIAGPNRMTMYAGVTYTVSAYVTLVSHDTSYRPVLCIRNSVGNTIIKSAGFPTTENTESLIFFNYTPDEDVTVYFSVIITGSNGGSASVTFRRPMIEAGSAVTDYEPYANICPISGWTGANIHVSPTTEAQDGTTYSITFPAEAGTVYGGTLDATTGVLTVDMAIRQAPSSGWQKSGSVVYITEPSKRRGTNTAISTHFPIVTYSSSDRIAINTDKTATEFNAMIAEINNSGTPMMICYELANPVTYQLTPMEITTLLGQNNIWADTGDIEVTYKVLKELY